jgi:type I restriction enzyme S subunit
VNGLARGNSPPSVQDGDVRSQRIPIPPEREQERIVSKIDELFSSIEEGERALERVRKLVEHYRQSVLKAAVTGELTCTESATGRVPSALQMLWQVIQANGTT